jgi:hypothetical protein
VCLAEGEATADSGSSGGGVEGVDSVDVIADGRGGGKLQGSVWEGMDGIDDAGDEGCPAEAVLEN